jgi:hypothetical protein
MTNSNWSPFDQFGRVRKLDGKADEKATKALNENQRGKLATLISVSDERDESEQRYIAARSDVHSKQTALAAAQAAYEPELPSPINPLTGQPVKAERPAAANLDPAEQNRKRMAAARAVAAAQQPGYKPAPPIENPAKDAVVTANAELISSQAEFRKCMAEFHALEAKFSEATEAYRQSTNGYYDPTLAPHIANARAQAKLMREHIARCNAERAARVARGEPAEAPKVTPNYQSPLDAKRGAAKRVVRPLMR